MTELNIAYSFNGGGGNDIDDNSMMDYHPEPTQQPQQQPQQPAPQPPQQVQIQPQQQAPIYYQSPLTMQQQQPTVRKQQQYQAAPQYSFWDRMMLSRNDVFKLILLSFVVVLGISIEKFGSHYINTYLTDNIFSPIQEFIVRLSYPLLIFIFLWIIKSL
jgi:hypothetical protein